MHPSWNPWKILEVFPGMSLVLKVKDMRRSLTARKRGSWTEEKPKQVLAVPLAWLSREASVPRHRRSQPPTHTIPCSRIHNMMVLV